jgi:Tfp pilus assembly protein PilZ
MTVKNLTFVERRKEHRLPYTEKIIFTDGKTSRAFYAANISRGGVFVMSLEPYPIETSGHLAFTLPNHPMSLCVKAKVVHIVFDRQKCEIECGMGFQFCDLNESQKSLVNLHILNEKSIYLELKKLLEVTPPDGAEIGRVLKKMPALARFDLLGLRYKVNRICTIFEPGLNPNDDRDEKTKSISA